MTTSENVPIEVISVDSSYIDVQLPFLDVPVKMNHELFKKRLNDGYFKVRNRSEKNIPSMLQTNKHSFN